MGDKRGTAKSPEFVIDLVVNRLRHTVLPTLDTIMETTIKLRSDLIISHKSLLEIADKCKESDPGMHAVIIIAANSVSKSAYTVRKLKDDLSEYVGNQVRGQAAALSRIRL